MSTPLDMDSRRQMLLQSKGDMLLQLVLVNSQRLLLRKQQDFLTCNLLRTTVPCQPAAMLRFNQQRSLWVFDCSLFLLCSDPSPTVHHAILHHQSPSSGNQAYDTLSLESSDSMETSVSNGNSACTPERWSTRAWVCGFIVLFIPRTQCWVMTRPPLPHFPPVSCSGCGIEAQRIEEMEKMLKEAQQEKARLIENRVSDGTSFYSDVSC